jgi:GntR family transcriptional regulator
MFIRIDPADARPIYVQIVDEVRRCIATGAVKAGEALPSVRDLAAELRVNPNTVQQAYRELERMDAVYAKRGQGTFVSAKAQADEDSERERIAEEVARKALREAYRHGLSADALISAIQSARDHDGESSQDDAPASEGK